MAGTQDKISVQCVCGDTHEFARQHAGRVARCPKLNRKFRVPERDSAVVFLDEVGPSHEDVPEESAPKEPQEIAEPGAPEPASITPAQFRELLEDTSRNILPQLEAASAEIRRALEQ